MKEYPVTLDITAITPEGFGVGRGGDGKVVFVPDTAVGDKVEASVIKILKNSSIARLVRVIAPSPERIAPDCAVCRKCGGCVFRHMSYDAEKAAKRRFVSDAFARIGGMDIEVAEVISGDPLRYRNKVQYPFAPDENGKCAFGYYARRSHRVVPHSECLLQDDDFTRVASLCAWSADTLGVKAYEEETRKGVLRHIVMRRSRDGKMSVCLVINGKPDLKVKKIADGIYEAFPFVTGVHINDNSRPDNVIFGGETVLAAGEEKLFDKLCGRTFGLSPRSFYQVNADMAEKLYEYAAGLVSVGGGVILDLYCGTGTVGLCVAGEGDKLCGVELIPEAVEDARVNARLNGRNENDTLFVCGDASVGVDECIKRFGKPDVIIVDPPRKGLDKTVIDSIVSVRPEKSVYISCDPATLARDCAIFAENGYKTHFAQPFDLFPRTGHVETVVLMSRTDAGKG